MTALKPGAVIGCRLIVGKHSATIRYIGPVDGQEGEWAGLEWDDPTRGKHDGSHGGHRYFTCQRHPSAGSFVRLSKLIETADFGQSLECAIEDRYKQSTNVLEINEDAYVPTASQRRVPIRLVGAAAAAEAVCFDGALEQASFIGMRISSITLTPSVASFLSRVAILDLSNNLLANWLDIAALATALPLLDTLNLSGNILDLQVNSTSIEPKTTIPSLRTLVLNGCGVTWPQALTLALYFPNLQALHLCGNNLSTLGGHPPDVNGSYTTMCSSLEILDLEDNKLSSWLDISATLQHIPKLNSLLLSGNLLTEVHAPSEQSFSTLEHLMLGNNRLNDWHVADSLDQFPSLIDVRLSDNPITALRQNGLSQAGVDGADARYEVIARISKLKILNGGVVSPGERWDAELAYLRRVTDELTAVEASSSSSSGESVATAKEAVLRVHLKYNMLVVKYGELTSSQTVATKGTTMNSTMVELVFVAGKKQIKKKVPGTLTIGKLKTLVERVLRVKLRHQALVLVNPSGSIREDVTQHDGKEIRFFEIGDGWKVELHERDVAEMAAAKVAVAVEQERRMEEHELDLMRLRAEEERLMVGLS